MHIAATIFIVSAVVYFLSAKIARMESKEYRGPQGQSVAFYIAVSAHAMAVLSGTISLATVAIIWVWG